MLLGATLLSVVIGVVACTKRDPVNDNVTISFSNETPSAAEQIALTGNVVLSNETSKTSK